MANFLDDCQTVDQTDFTGANLLVDEEDARQPQALYNRNIMFSEGLFRVRDGFGPAFVPAGIAKSMYNWLQQKDGNRLLYLTPGALISRDLTGVIAEQSVLAVNASGFTAIESGVDVYMAFFDAAGSAVTTVKVWNGKITDDVPDLEDVFAPALDVSQLSGGVDWGTAAEIVPGVVTAGTHYYALVVMTHNGFQTPPGPNNAGTFSPQNATSSGGMNIQIVVNPATVWPSYAQTIQLAMTTAADSARWYLVPQDFGGIVTVSGAPTFPAIFNVDIDDGSLTQATEITDTLFNLFTGPLACHCITSYGNRAVYIYRGPGPNGIDIVGGLFFSDPFKPQYVIPYINGLSLPEFKDCTTGFELGSTFFALGPGCTFAWVDNLQQPDSWSPPRLVSGNIGSPFIRGVNPAPDKGYAWVADRTGLFCFAGQNYPILPMSYYQTPDWERINFNADANALVVKEVPSLRMVFVKAPLDGANLATHMLVWNIVDGVTPDKVKYCGTFNLLDFPEIGDIEVVTSHATKIRELYVSRGDAVGNVRRMKSIAAGDATEDDPEPLFDDDGEGIDALYRFLAVVEARRGKQQQIGLRVRHRGLGQTNIKAYSFDNDFAIPMAPITAAEASMTPGHRYLRLVDMQSETATYEFSNGAIPGAFFIIAAIRSYFLPWMDE